ncbi:MAG TPA: CoA-binding protein [Symbiobacteriaceae bacterium]|nr:CoA-binding protein [Symbiobacteriaceae bacterium]
MPSRSVAREFLGQRRIAVVGVSRNKDDFSRLVFKKFQDRGYEVYAVNPAGESTESMQFYPSVRDLPEPVDGALLMVPATRSESVIRDCQAAGIRRVWLYGSGHQGGSVSPEAMALARSTGMSVVDGICPLMFIGGFPHNIHRWFTHFEP